MWIKCTEKMPEPMLPVLVFTPGRGKDVAWLVPWESPMDGGRHDSFQDDDNEFRRVTHWMPLPDDPTN